MRMPRSLPNALILCAFAFLSATSCSEEHEAAAWHCSQSDPEACVCDKYGNSESASCPDFPCCKLESDHVDSDGTSLGERCSCISQSRLGTRTCEELIALEGSVRVEKCPAQ
jgi:hypothetical protein